MNGPVAPIGKARLMQRCDILQFFQISPAANGALKANRHDGENEQLIQ